MSTHKDTSRRTAAALRYHAGEDAAPSVVARGTGEIAKRIIALAKAHDIPIYEDAETVEALVQLELGSEIAPELYEVVAELLAFVYSMDKAQSVQEQQPDA